MINNNAMSASYNDIIRIKLLENKVDVSLSIRESETKVSTFIIPRKDFEKMILDYNTYALYNMDPDFLDEIVEEINKD